MCVIMKRFELFLLLVFGFFIDAWPLPDADLGGHDLRVITQRLVENYLDVQVDEEGVGNCMKMMREDGSFPDIDYVTVYGEAYFPQGTHLKRLDSMAVAYRKQGNKFYKDKKLLSLIRAGLSYWQRMDPQSRNWWFNDIGAPQDYMIVVLLLKGEIGNDELLGYSSYLRDLTGNKGHRGKNRTWVSNITIHKGCIENNPELLKRGFQSIASTIEIVRRQGDEGIKVDGSFHQHRPQLYSGGYGLSYADDIAYYLLLVKDTGFESYFTEEKRSIFSNLLLGGHRFLGYRHAFDFGAVGRNISRPNGVGNISALTLRRMEQGEPQHAADYVAWRKHLDGEAFPVCGNRYFWKSDMMTQHGANYYLSAKVVSRRTNGTEMLNNENLKGYNLPLGATNIMTSGKEYENIFPLWNWNQIPGTTAVQNPDSARLEGYLFGRNDFGGGVSTGVNGVLAYEHDYKGVKAHKAYFFLNDVLLCLGAGISSEASDDVATTVNQCFYAGNVTVGEGASQKNYVGNVLVEHPVWVYHDNVGYWFPDAENVTVESRRHTGSWKDINVSESGKTLSADLFNLKINHGMKPKDDKYVYMIVPDRTLADFQKLITTDCYKIIENSSKVQAVKTGEQYAVVFYEPCSVELEPELVLRSEEAVVVYIEKDTETYKIWAGDPLFKQNSARLFLNNREINIDFPSGDYTGSTVSTEVAAVQPCALLCEYLRSPEGIDVWQPRLSWKFGNTTLTRGKRQVAYQLLVASSQELLEKGIGDLWDSGIVRSSESVNIVYEGTPLHSFQRCFWKVRMLDEQSAWSAWSETASWRMGLLEKDWNAHWIGSEEMERQSKGGKKVDNEMYDPWLRKTFILSDFPKDAVLCVASIGYHELYVNGRKVGDAVLSPSVTDHKSRARYKMYDITKYLQKGENVIALWLGTSWAIFPAYQREDKPAIPLLLAQAEICLHSGEKLRIVSDDSWKVHASPNKLMGYWEAHHFAGEYYDANLEIPDWNTIKLDDSDWAKAKVYKPSICVSSDRTEPNRLIKEIRPVSIQKMDAGTYRVDMGVNYAGWFEMPVEGTPGDSILFQFSEREDAECSYGIQSIYRIGKNGKGIFCNRFNYMTGRWVYISGLSREPRLEQIKGWMIRPDYQRSGGFDCDISLLNDIYRTALWTFENLSLGNYVVDCPHRERCGYGGDALATTRMALGNYRLGAFYSKWMEDWRDVQEANGNIPYTAPTRIGGGGPSWSGYCITLPWMMYQWYGDIRILQESFSTIQEWLDFLETKAENDMLVRWGGKWSFLGDWLWPDAWPERRAMESKGLALGDTRETLFFNNCHWIYSLETASQIAGILGLDEVKDVYQKRAAQVRKAVHASFFNPDDNSYVNGYPAYLAMAITVGLPPENLKEKVWKRLEQEILVNRKGHFWGGITAGSFLMYTLLDNGRDDLIFEMVSKDDFPSWGYMLKKKIGTFYEDWQCRGSALHSSYLYVGSWFIEALGGIRHLDAGYKSFVIEPWISDKGPKRVNTYYDSMYGRIISNWMLNDGVLNLEITVPANTTATLVLPAVYGDGMKEKNVDWGQVKGVEQDMAEEGKTSFKLQSGVYHFTVQANK